MANGILGITKEEKSKNTAQRNLGFICLPMTIETKFNIGDEVWYLYNNKVSSGKIETIRAKVSTIERFNFIHYYIISSTESLTLEEKSVFSSKEELIKSL